ncbi:MAG TPA: hypothetical protein VK324_10920 [Tepidisphaeraceae bacterium]|nr:hypothetical protein [Tepidisphaeraceae bacterium]
MVSASLPGNIHLPPAFTNDHVDGRGHARDETPPPYQSFAERHPDEAARLDREFLDMHGEELLAELHAAWAKPKRARDAAVAVVGLRYRQRFDEFFEGKAMDAVNRCETDDFQ